MTADSARAASDDQHLRASTSTEDAPAQGALSLADSLPAAAAAAAVPSESAAPAASASAAAAAAAAAPPASAAARPWFESESKATVWARHPREDSYGALLVASATGAPLDASSLSRTPLADLRFLLVQRRSTAAFSNLCQHIQESSSYPDSKAEWWLAREVSRLTDGELDLFGSPFDGVWADERRVSDAWKVRFRDANEQHARERWPQLQQLVDRIRTERHVRAQVDPPDADNTKLAFVVPKGQLQTSSSVQRLPHLSLALDADERAAAVREVWEETDIPPSDFELAPVSEAPLRFALYPPRKVDIFLAFVRPESRFHPTRQEEWTLQPNPETLRCKWMTLIDAERYFVQARISPNTYTRIIMRSLAQRFGWTEQVRAVLVAEQPQWTGSARGRAPPPPPPAMHATSSVAAAAAAAAAGGPSYTQGARGGQVAAAPPPQVPNMLLQMQAFAGRLSTGAPQRPPQAPAQVQPLLPAEKPKHKKKRRRQEAREREERERANKRAMGAAPESDTTGLESPPAAEAEAEAEAEAAPLAQPLAEPVAAAEG